MRIEWQKEEVFEGWKQATERQFETNEWQRKCADWKDEPRKHQEKESLREYWG